MGRLEENVIKKRGRLRTQPGALELCEVWKWRQSQQRLRSFSHRWCCLFLVCPLEFVELITEKMTVPLDFGVVWKQYLEFLCITLRIV